MNTKPRTYLSALAAAAEVQVRDRLPELRRGTCQHFADQRDWVGLETFYAEVLFIGVAAPVRARIAACLAKLPAVRGEFEVAFSRALRMAGRSDRVKALYCEYFLDPAGGSGIDLFPCVRFARDDDDWACEFEQVVEGPAIRELLDYDPGRVVPEPASLVVADYLHAVLLGAFGRLLDRHAELELPVGFAEHDYPIIYIGAAG